MATLLFTTGTIRAATPDGGAPPPEGMVVGDGLAPRPSRTGLVEGNQGGPQRAARQGPRGAVDLLRVRVDKRVDHGAFTRAIRERNSAFVRCYDRVLEGNPLTAGRLGLTLALTPTGITAIELVRPTELEDDPLMTCLRTALRAIPALPMFKKGKASNARATIELRFRWVRSAVSRPRPARLPTLR